MVDAKVCRQLFLREGIVERKINGKLEAIQPFWKVYDTIEQQEDQIRRRNRLLDTNSIVALLDSKIPKQIVSVSQLQQWYKNASEQQRQKLQINAQELLRDNADKMPDLPKFWQLNDIQLPITYLFEPDAEDDGMTVQIPLAILGSLQTADFEYLIPSLLREKIIALLRGLPKKIRKNFVPVPNFADALLERMGDRNELNEMPKLLPTIVQHLKQITGVTVETSDFNESEVPEHLQVNFNLIDNKGKSLCKGRNLKRMQQMSEVNDWQSEPLPLSKTTQHTEETFTDWPSQLLHEPVETNPSGIKITQYPGLEDKQSAVIIKLYSSANEALFATASATIRLLLLNLQPQRNDLQKQLPDKQKISLGYSSIGSFQELVDDLCWFSLKQLTAKETIASKQQFDKVLENARSNLMATVTENMALLLPVLTAMTAIKKSLKGRLSPLAIASYQDIGATLNGLIYPHFLRDISLQRLHCYPRYFRSLQLRFEKLPQSANRERAAIEALEQWRQKLQALNERILPWSQHQEDLQQLNWMFDELSVSLFTQELGTAMTVSEKRLGKYYSSLIQVLG